MTKKQSESELKHKLAAWRAQADAWRARLVKSYDSVKPNRRDHILRSAKSGLERLGSLEMHIRNAENGFNRTVEKSSEPSPVST